MQQVYGPVTAFAVMVVVTLLVQVIKSMAPSLSDRAKQLIALGVAVILIVPFEILSIWPNVTPIDAYSAFIYALFGWFSSMGMYKAAQVQLGVKNDSNSRPN